MAVALLIACVRGAAATVDVILPDVQVEPGARVTLPIEVSDVTEDQLSAAEFTLVYDPSVATFISVTTVGGLAQGWLLSHKSADGQVGIALASARPTSGSGALVYTVFEVLPCATGTTDLTLARVRLNRDIPVTIRNGSIAVDSGPLTDFRMRLPAAWDLVSLPGAGDPAALRGITATAYGWDAPTQGYTLLQSVDAHSLPAVTGGAFVRHLRVHDSTVVSMNLDTNNACVRAAATTLYPGWNIVGAPAEADTPVSVAALRNDSSTGWSAISANSVLAYDPESRSYAPAVSLEAGHAHWVYNGLGREHLVSLPQARDLVGGNSAPTRRTGPAVSAPSLRMRLTNAAGMSAEVSLVLSDRAQVGFDALDVPAPPPPPGGDAPRVHVLSESRPSRLMRSARPLVNNAVSWLLATEASAQGVLSWDAAPLPDGYMAALDLDGARHDLRRPGSVTLPPGERRFAVNVKFVAPNSTRVFANYPNPFNPETWIPYSLSEASEVSLRIYDARGGLVRTLELGRREAGSHLTRAGSGHWDGLNELGELVAGGVYYVELRAGDSISMRRLMLSK
ncbi:hypothetical protein HN371_29640 [Candidatus Poribacteria bacterium]|jgi:hypothetical protein|nr:hypothetical protein [Candidatus Poribacteria bacterium]MBT5534183.1 hypothetical protein [Candidatus Poribacteria bacterium]MBT5710323.1 hypothetical protein [Candidatus Poribacteria bacterium]MBT7101186.1 hypothetical protein [Candidatus Poribacteria bacterium]MBT7808382.1 hypothetical protein [Candidatus Poribacteria bacterium]